MDNPNMYSETSRLFHLWINPIISSIGCVSCLASFIIFIRPTFTERYFIHIHIEILSMLTNLLITCAQPIYYWHLNVDTMEQKGIPLYSYYYYKYFVVYGKSIFELMALYSNILTNVTFISYVFTTKVKNDDKLEVCCLKRHLGLVYSALMFIGCSGIFSYMLKKYNITRYENGNETFDEWKIVENTSMNFVYFELVVMGIRDVIGIVLLLTTNFILLWKVSFYSISVNRFMLIVNNRFIFHLLGQKADV